MDPAGVEGLPVSLAILLPVTSPERDHPGCAVMAVIALAVEHQIPDRSNGLAPGPAELSWA
jgi:hypothetical protein